MHCCHANGNLKKFFSFFSTCFFMEKNVISIFMFVLCLPFNIQHMHSCNQPNQKQSIIQVDYVCGYQNFSISYYIMTDHDIRNAPTFRIFIFSQMFSTCRGGIQKVVKERHFFVLFFFGEDSNFKWNKHLGVYYVLHIKFQALCKCLFRKGILAKDGIFPYCVHPCKW